MAKAACVDLDDQLAAFVEAQVSAGRHDSASEVVAAQYA